MVLSLDFTAKEAKLQRNRDACLRYPPTCGSLGTGSSGPHLLCYCSFLLLSLRNDQIARAVNKCNPQDFPHFPLNKSDALVGALGTFYQRFLLSWLLLLKAASQRAPSVITTQASVPGRYTGQNQQHVHRSAKASALNTGVTFQSQSQNGREGSPCAQHHV